MLSGSLSPALGPCGIPLELFVVVAVFVLLLILVQPSSAGVRRPVARSVRQDPFVLQVLIDPANRAPGAWLPAAAHRANMLNSNMDSDSAYADEHARRAGKIGGGSIH